MAPRGTPVKSSPQIQRAISKTKFSVIKTKATKSTDQTPKESKVTPAPAARERMKTVPTPGPVRAKENVPVTAAKTTVPGSIKKLALSSTRKIAPGSAKKLAPGSAKKMATGSASKPAWKRRPKAAHSGVPVPEKMRKLFANLKDDDF